MKIVQLETVYTGGGIFIFCGMLETGNYFLTDDYGATIITDTDPMPYIEAGTELELWEGPHNLKELIGKKRLAFCKDLIKYMRINPKEHLLTDSEVNYYEEYFKEEW